MGDCRDTLPYPVAPYLEGTQCTLLADRGLSCLELIHQWKPGGMALRVANQTRGMVPQKVPPELS